MNPACPACAGRSRLDRWDDVAGFECQTCAAHFIRAAALESFLDKHPHAPEFSELRQLASAAPASARSLTCPDCHTNTYHVVRSGGVELDICVACVGVFLDKGEASVYLRQTRRKPAGHAAEKTVDTIHGVQAILDIIYILIP